MGLNWRGERRTRVYSVPLTPGESEAFLAMCLAIGVSSSELPRQLVLEYMREHYRLERLRGLERGEVDEK